MEGNLAFSCLSVVLVFLIEIKGGITSDDPCSSYMTLPDISRRSPYFIYNASTPALSDNTGFDEGWYRAGYYDMPNSRIENNRCGTVYPFYLQDPIPVNDDISENRACLGDAWDPCYSYKNIKVRNCTEQGYRVYYLVPMGFDSAAYCFEYRGWDEIPPYKVDKAEAQYHDLIWETENGIDIPRLRFKCDFTPLADESLYYAVTWKVDNHKKVGETKVASSSSLQLAYLNEKELTDAGFRHGINLFCEVGVRYHPNGLSGEITSGAPFYAGIKFPHSSMTINEGEKVSVTLQMTVPFACNSTQGDCDLPVQMIDLGDLGECGSSLIVTDSDKCSALFTGKSKGNAGTFYSSETWKQPSYLPMQQSHVDSFAEYPYFTLALTTGEASHLFWSNNRLPTMTVNVQYELRNWRGRRCHAVADPHVYSFDGMNFEQHNPGTYIFYQNGKQEVHYKTQSCFTGIQGAHCVCGVAARAGRDVFAIDICGGRKLIGFLMCEDSTLTVKSDKGSKYEVTFPTGTKVELNVIFNSQYMNVYINPSGNDEYNAIGLCGDLDGDCTNDLKKKDGTIIPENNCGYSLSKKPDEFTNSWRVTDDESFFEVGSAAFDTLLSWDSSAVFCRCATATLNGTERGPMFDDNADCSTRQYNECEKPLRFKDFRCYVKPLNRRKRRDISPLRQQSAKRETMDFSSSALENKRKRRSIDERMSEEEARYNCEAVFNQSEIARICTANVEQIDNTYLENCILDLWMTGNVSLAEPALQLLLDACYVFVSKNVTLINESPDIVNVIYISTCPANCSGNGNCVKGECICDNGYTGTDCSKDVSAPPTISDIDDSGICDKAAETCNDIFVYGENFVETGLTKCKFDTQLKLMDGSIVDGGISILNGTQISVFEAVCVPPAVADSSVLYPMYTVSVSNDGTAYSNSIQLYIYDSTCQNLNNNTGVVSFTLKDNYCFIERQCISKGMVNPENSCMVCDPSENITSWSSTSGCGTSTAASATHSSPINDASFNTTTTTIISFSPSPISIGTTSTSPGASSSTTSSALSTPKSDSPGDETTTSTLSSSSTTLIGTTSTTHIPSSSTTSIAQSTPKSDLPEDETTTISTSSSLPATSSGTTSTPYVSSSPTTSRTQSTPLADSPGDETTTTTSSSLPSTSIGTTSTPYVSSSSTSSSQSTPLSDSPGDEKTTRTTTTSSSLSSTSIGTTSTPYVSSSSTSSTQSTPLSDSPGDETTTRTTTTSLSLSSTSIGTTSTPHVSSSPTTSSTQSTPLSDSPGDESTTRTTTSTSSSLSSTSIGTTSPPHLSSNSTTSNTQSSPVSNSQGDETTTTTLTSSSKSSTLIGTTSTSHVAISSTTSSAHSTPKSDSPGDETTTSTSSSPSSTLIGTTSTTQVPSSSTTSIAQSTSKSDSPGDETTTKTTATRTTSSSPSSTSGGTASASHVASSSTTSIGQSTPKSDSSGGDDPNIYMYVTYITLPLVVVCIGLIVGIIIIKVKSNSSQARTNKNSGKDYDKHSDTPQSRLGSALTGYDIYPHVRRVYNNNTYIPNSWPPVSFQNYNYYRPASGQTISREVMERDTSKGPDFSMY